MSFQYFFDRIEDSERSRSEFSKSSTRLKNIKNSRRYDIKREHVGLKSATNPL